jgi:hypothetical protein
MNYTHSIWAKYWALFEPEVPIETSYTHKFKQLIASVIIFFNFLSYLWMLLLIVSLINLFSKQVFLMSICWTCCIKVSDFWHIFITGISTKISFTISRYMSNDSNGSLSGALSFEGMSLNFSKSSLVNLISRHVILLRVATSRNCKSK